MIGSRVAAVLTSLWQICNVRNGDRQKNAERPLKRRSPPRNLRLAYCVPTTNGSSENEKSRRAKWDSVVARARHYRSGMINDVEEEEDCT
jgi:hypothetical protein